MGTMDDSIPHPGQASILPAAPGWKTAVSWISAVIISFLFLLAGLWEITDVPGGAVKLQQALVPESLSLAAALLLGIGNTFAGVLILVPRFRRWGAWLASLLLVVFMGYFAINYSTLRGEECGCFPWIERAVGPAFFISDAVMLVLAILAGVWARPSQGKRSAALVLAAVSVFALVSYGVAAVRQSGALAPASITVEGQAFPLREGRVFLYFFNPECTHCLDAARRLGALNWGDTRVVAVATEQVRFGQDFLRDAGFQARLSGDVAPLREAFPFTDPPFAVAIEEGRQKLSITGFTTDKPFQDLKRLGFTR